MSVYAKSLSNVYCVVTLLLIPAVALNHRNGDNHRASIGNARESSTSSTRVSLRTAASFEEPLIPVGNTSPKEDAALFQAISIYKAKAIPDDFTAFDLFLAKFPRSGWRVALLTNLGLAYYHYGYFSKAIESWEKAWAVGRDASTPEAKALVDRAAGELARMHARLGHADRLESLFKELGDRPVSGPATEAIVGAKEGLWTMRNDPGIAYLCGPMALKNLLLSQGADLQAVQFLDEYRSSRQGVTLAEVASLAQKAKLSFKLAYRRPNREIPIPSVVHWKVGHFAALLAQTGNRFHVQDPTFGTDLWITRNAIESESSGYFLVPGDKLIPTLREVNLAEASKIRGMGFTGSNDPNATSPDDVPAFPSDPGCGMCGYNIAEMVVSLILKDGPVGYTPPKGPSVRVSLTYNQREAGQPALFTFFNVSPKWTMNWLSYIQDDPTAPGASVTRYVAGGGYENYLFYDSSSGFFGLREWDTQNTAFLQRASDTPIKYLRHLSDGGMEVY